MVLLLYGLIGCPQSFGMQDNGLITKILYLEIPLPLSHRVQNSKADKFKLGKSRTWFDSGYFPLVLVDSPSECISC